MKIIVISGGATAEREVSVKSGANVTAALLRKGHECIIADFYPDGEHSGKIIAAARGCDVAFPAVHGGDGEDGTLQSLLKLCGIKYVGSSPEGCRNAMNKNISKLLYRQNGIITPKWQAVKDGFLPDLPFPYVLKPISGGSSVGVKMIYGKEAALGAISSSDSPLMAEELVRGREFSVGICLGKPMPPVEIKTENEFYDYKSKYDRNRTDEICPAEITAAEKEMLCDAAAKAHKALGLGDFSRSDMIMSDGKIYLLETNACPGLTSVSLFPLEAEKSGMGFDTVCDSLVKAAFEREAGL